MKTKLLILFLFFTTLASAQLRIFFDPGKAILPDSAKKQLIAFIEAIKKQGYNSIMLEGNTDNTGTSESNSTLSLLRARAVKKFLVQHGLDENYISTKGNGESNPLAENLTASGRQLNRRTDISFSINTPLVTETNVSEDGDISELFEKLKDEGEQYCIKPDRDTALVGENGTIVYYTANTFKITGPCSCIRIVLHEYYKKSDLILNNLTTTSDGRPLVSGGMVKLEGYCNDSLLSFDPGKYMTVMVPTDTLDSRMKLFSANRLEQKDLLNWKLDPDYPELDFMNWQNMYWNCVFKGQPPGPCPFFFCQIKGFFNGLFSGSPNRKTKLEKDYEKEKKLLDKFALKEGQMSDALSKSRKNNSAVLNYYVYKNANWDYHNIDMFANGNPTDFTIEETSNRSKDFKLVAQKTKTILPARPAGNTYGVKNIFTDIDVWVVGLKYVQGKSFLALKEENTNSRKTTVDFVPVSIEDLKKLLQKLDK